MDVREHLGGEEEVAWAGLSCGCGGEGWYQIVLSRGALKSWV